jgi:hypothetical protein
VLTASAQKNMSYAVVTMPLSVQHASHQATEEATAIFEPYSFPDEGVEFDFPSPLPPPPLSASSASSPSVSLQPQVLPPEVPSIQREPSKPPLSTFPTKRSSSKWWIGIGSSAAALAFVTTAIVIQRNSATPDQTIIVVPETPATNPAPSAVPQAVHPELNRQLTTLQTETADFEKENPDVKIDATLTPTHQSLVKNLERADIALQSSEFEKAQTYLRLAQEDLTTLKQKQLRRSSGNVPR